MSKLECTRSAVPMQLDLVWMHASATCGPLAVLQARIGPRQHASLKLLQSFFEVTSKQAAHCTDSAIELLRG